MTVFREAVRPPFSLLVLDLLYVGGCLLNLAAKLFGGSFGLKSGWLVALPDRFLNLAFQFVGRAFDFVFRAVFHVCSPLRG